MIDRLIGLEGAARARGYGWGGTFAEGLHARSEHLQAWPGWSGEGAGNRVPQTRLSAPTKGGHARFIG